jgi:hypothetical protein
VLIFWKERLVFLANTKTGSTSIEAALDGMAHVAIRRPPELKHMRARRYRRFMAPLLEQSAGAPFSTLAVMRDPIDWLGSWFRYRQRDEIRDEARSTAEIAFAEFVAAYLSDDPPPYAQVGSQAQFLCAEDGATLVDHVFRYETLATFIAFLEDRLGCEITLPRMNVSPRAALDLPGPLRDRLRARFSPDYRLYESLAG